MGGSQYPFVQDRIAAEKFIFLGERRTHTRTGYRLFAIVILRTISVQSQELVYEARRFAITAHRAINHTRKYTGDPYEVHLSSVARLVEEAGGSQQMIAAAWLHDVLEDTDTVYGELETVFGREVADLVAEVTDVSRPRDGNRRQRKTLDREHLAKASPHAQTIKLADLINNAISVIEHDSGFARTFMAEMEQLLEVLDSGDHRLLAEAKSIAAEWAKTSRNI